MKKLIFIAVFTTGLFYTIVAQSEMTTFNPDKHGFKFANNFKSTVGDAGSIKITTGGLCGGMAYAANDYFLNRKSIPKQDYLPQTGSKLHKYIFDRQMNSFANLEKYVEFTINPFGWRDEEFFYWGLEDRLKALMKSIDRNVPVPLGLFNIHNDPSSHHQVLAIGYDLGKYSWKRDKDPYRNQVKIFIYDPNNPSKICMLKANSGKNYFEEWIMKKKGNKLVMNKQKNKYWRSYFIDENYRKKVPVTINQPQKTKDNKFINRLVFELQTGDDDLRGGNDNLDIIVETKKGNIYSLCVNKKHRWPDNHTQFVEIFPQKKIYVNDIKQVKLKGTMSGGMGGDNWNMDKLAVKAYLENGEVKNVYSKSAEPFLMRFTGKRKVFIAKIK